MTRPGDGLRRIAARVCDQRTMERLVEPIVADLQAEYDTAAAQGDWRARWLVWRGYGAFWKALGLHCIMSTFQPSRSDSNDSMRRVAAFSIGALAIMTALLVVPPMLDFKWDGGPLEKLRLILLLVPQALPLSIPMGICVGVVCAMRGRRTEPPPCCGGPGHRRRCNVRGVDDARMGSAGGEPGVSGDPRRASRRWSCSSISIRA